LSQFRLSASVLAITGALTACGESAGILPATVENAVDTATIYALTGTPIGTRSGFDIILGLPTRPEIGDNIDFAFDFDSAGTAILYPALLVGASSIAGFLRSTETFDEIERAPLEDYVADSVLTVTEGATFFARSRVTNLLCGAFFGSIPRYGKFEVLAIDPTERTITLKFMINLNCGYRDLTPGLPAS
jgi:hypothetical protein